MSPYVWQSGTAFIGRITHENLYSYYTATKTRHADLHTQLKLQRLKRWNSDWQHDVKLNNRSWYNTHWNLREAFGCHRIRGAGGGNVYHHNIHNTRSINKCKHSRNTLEMQRKQTSKKFSNDCARPYEERNHLYSRNHKHQLFEYKTLQRLSYLVGPVPHRLSER